jgi:hypothetical protein
MLNKSRSGTQCSPLFLPVKELDLHVNRDQNPVYLCVRITLLGFAWKPLIVGQSWHIVVTFGELLSQSDDITASKHIQFREAKIQAQHVLNDAYFRRSHASHHYFRLLKTREVHNGL